MEKLQDSNFPIWKQKVELLLAFRELDDQIYDPQARSDPRDLNNGKRMMQKRRRLLRFCLVMSTLIMSRELKGHVDESH